MTSEDWLVDRENLARKIELQSRPDRKKRRWLKHNCQKCGYLIEYEPKPDFSGELRCPHCGSTVKVSRLDDYSGSKEVKE
jgi:rubrerythrin